MKRMALGLFVSIVAVASFAPATAEDGVWTPDDNFSQVNVACTRVYTCGPISSVMYGDDKKLVSTAPKIVWGVCSAGDGPVDSCNACLTTPPTEKCEWHLEPK